LATRQFLQDSASLGMSMSQKKSCSHCTNVISALEQQRDEPIAAFVAKSPQLLEGFDVAFRMLVSGLSVSVPHSLRLRGYVLGELVY
jgi:hypothetical protein